MRETFNNHKVRAIVADDHPLFRDGLVRALTGSGLVEVVAEAEDGTSALEAIKKDAPNNTDDLMADTIATMKERKLIMNADTEKMGFGVMTEERWMAHYQILKEANLLKSDVDVKSVLALQFLKAATN